MIQITNESPDIKLTDGMKEAIEKTGEKVEKYTDGLSIDCFIRKQAKEKIHVLMKFKPRHGKEIQASADSSDFYKAVGLSQKRLVRQILDQKSKKEDEKKHPTEDIKVLGAKEAEESLTEKEESEAA